MDNKSNYEAQKKKDDIFTLVLSSVMFFIPFLLFVGFILYCLWFIWPPLTILAAYLLFKYYQKHKNPINTN